MTPEPSRPRQDAWAWQWSRFRDEERWLFADWIHPTRLEDFRGKSVLDLGCGSGQHLDWTAEVAARVVGVDRSTAAIARERNRRHPNVEVLEGDIATFDTPERFDFVYCVGVLHHTDEPARTFANIRRFVKPGGRLILWVYSREGNFLNRALLEPAKALLLGRLPRPVLSALAWALTLLLTPAVWTLYRLPLPWLPFYEYFENFRRLPLRRNCLNVFDKLNAPTTHFLSEQELRAWFSPERFEDVHLERYRGVSWRASGRAK